jgi:hypothetical protein
MKLTEQQREYAVEQSIDAPGLDSNRVDWEFLRSQLNEILRFAVLHVPEVQEYAAMWPDDLDPLIRLQDKIIAETALLVLLVARVAPPGSETYVLLDMLVTQLKAIARSERHRVLLLRYPQTTAPLGLAHAALTALGYPDPEMQHILTTIVSRNLEHTIERIPYRCMEMRWVRSLIQPELIFDVNDLLPYTILGSRSHPFIMSREDVYAVTHALMYATGFGSKPAPVGIDLSAVLGQIDSCLAWVLITEDLDLIIELILAATLLRMPWSPYVRFAWDFVCDVWLDLGFLPSPSLVPSELQKRSGKVAAAYIFQNVYHTMYVAGLLCSVLLMLPQDDLTATWIPPVVEHSDLLRNCKTAAEKARQFCHSTVAAPSDAPDEFVHDAIPSIAILSDLLTSLAPSYTRWKKMIGTFAMDSAEIARIIADCTIIHAVRAYDLPKLLAALDEAIKITGPLSSTVLEAIDFLIRQQLFDGVIGVHFVVPANRASRAAIEVTEVIGDRLRIYAARLSMNTLDNC